MEKEIECFIHDHPLILTEKKQNDEVNCSVCELPISGPAYSCSQCKDFATHKSCAELPQQIEHPFHSKHSLTLFRKTPNDLGYCFCDACKKECSGFVFHCAGCKFNLDIGCTSLLPTRSYEAHPHPLAFFEKIHQNYICECCKIHSFAGGSVFRCVDCKYTAHQSCVELPQQIQYPFHPLHPLTPMFGNFRCNACKIRSYESGFRCEECDFNLHEKCASLLPTIRYEGHEHLLTLFELIDEHQVCDSCETPCDAFVLRCVECGFNLHPQCLPSLPRTIKHDCHIDPLTLTDSVVDEDDDSNEYYCDACEESRDPKYPVYYCAECGFVAHIGCVIYEVLPSIIAEQESSMKVGAKVEVGRTKLDKEIVKLREEIEAMKAILEAKVTKLEVRTKRLKAMITKLETIEGKRAECFALQGTSA